MTMTVTCNSFQNNAIYTNSNSSKTINGKKCSAYTHVFADTLRSIAVLCAAIMAEYLPNVTPEEADASAAVAVSFIIAIALLPLFSGLINTLLELYAIHREEVSEKYTMTSSLSLNRDNNKCSYDDVEDHSNHTIAQI